MHFLLPGLKKNLIALSLRIIFVLRVIRDLVLYSRDVENAYLRAPLPKPEYMKLPAGYGDGGGRTYGKLLRAMPGKVESGKLWHKRLSFLYSTFNKSFHG